MTCNPKSGPPEGWETREIAMRVSKFSEQQIALILKQVDDGLGVEDVCRKAGLSQRTYYRWRKKYG
jgi:putative transposase